MKRLALFAFLLLSVAATNARPDALNGIFTYQIATGTYSNVTAPNGQNAAVGVDNAGAVLLTNGNGPDVLYDPSTKIATPIALQGSLPGSSNFAEAIAGNGDVLGSYVFDSRDFFIQHLNGSTTLINLPPAANGFVSAINSKGIVAGVLGDESAGFLFNTNTGSVTTILSGAPFSANLISINDRGQVVYAVGNQDFILNPDGTSMAINLPSGCHARDMNDSDQIVGSCAFASNSANGVEGFLLSGGKFSTINFPNANQNTTEVIGINDNGEIVGEYQNVPEPGTLCLLGAGLLALCGFKKFI
jgi:hypothetical protein